MAILDIVAPILLMLGIARTNSANVSLLNNFEIVATSIIALVVFKEAHFSNADNAEQVNSEIEQFILKSSRNQKSF